LRAAAVRAAPAGSAGVVRRSSRSSIAGGAAGLSDPDAKAITATAATARLATITSSALMTQAPPGAAAVGLRA
jgi:hypothetical protein